MVAVTASSFYDPLVTLWLSFLNIVPGLVGALIVLIIGYLVSLIIGHAVTIVLEKIGLNKKLKEAELTNAIGHTNVSNVLGEITKWYIFVIFLQVAVDLLNLGTLSVLLSKFVSWLPNIIVAILAALFGFFIAHYVEIKMTQNSTMKGTKIAARLIKVAIMIIIIIISLSQVGIDVSILQNVFLLVVGAIAVGFALAFGIGMGLGMKDKSQKMIDDFKKNF